MPAGKAIAMAAMPTAVLMGMGFTPTLALADDQPPTSNSLKADEYKDCVAALEGDKDKDAASPSPSPSASGGEEDGEKDENTSEPTPSAPAGGSDADKDPADSSGSSDSGSDDTGGKTEPTPTPSPSSGTSGEDDAATPSPSPSQGSGNVLEDIGDAIGGIFDGGKSTESPSPTPSASASPSGDTDESEDTSNSPDTGEDAASDTVEETTDKVTDTAKDTVKDTAGTASKAAEDTTEAVEKAAEAAEDAAGKATASPSPSASPSVDPEDCPAATDAEGGVDNEILVPDDPWYLEASSLTLDGADYQGIVEVKTASGATKKVLKYVINKGTVIGDLHQLVKDKQSGKTHHVQAAKGSESTITGGKTVMYTEKISGNLLGLVPVTFDPEHPPPLNIPWIYFTNAKVTQAGQFGGTLTVPGLSQYVTD